MAYSLVITDGITAVSFLSGTTTQYRVSEWQPAVATRRAGDLGGRGPYNDVVEEMTISIKSTTPAAALATLQGLMDQAQRWGRGELVRQVYIQYQPTSTSEALVSPILGAVGDAPMVELPPNFVFSAATGTIDGIVLRFRRYGLWLGGAASITSSAAANPTVATLATFTAAGVDSPFKLELLDIENNFSEVFNSFVLVSGAVGATAAAKRIVVVEAESLTASSFTSTVADSGNNARGGNVLRFTPSGPYYADYSDCGFANVSSSTDNDARRWGMFVNYRNNSGTTTFRIAADIYQGTSSDTYVTTPDFIVPAGVSDPKWGFVGTVTLSTRFFGFELLCAADAASGTLDIDCMAFIALDNPASDRVISLLESTPKSLSSPSDLIIDHRLLESISPYVYMNDGMGLPLGWHGDATLFMDAKTTVLAACWLATDGTKWRAMTSAPAIQDPEFKATRLTGYLVPV